MSKNKCSFHSLKFVLLIYKLKSAGLTWTSLVYGWYHGECIGWGIFMHEGVDGLWEHGLDLSGLGEGQVAGCCEHSNKPLCSITWGRLVTSLEAISFSRKNLLHRFCCMQYRSCLLWQSDYTWELEDVKYRKEWRIKPNGQG